MEIIVRATLLYFFLWAIARGTGKRELSQMTAFELVLLVSMGDLIQQGVTQEDMSITGAVLAVSTFAFWVSAFTWLSWRSDRARRTIEGVPLVVVRDGEPVEEALRIERMPMAELLEAARRQGVDDLSTVRLAVLEPNGAVSIIKMEG